jgi:transcriptional regulator with XRE-family HTH domain
MINGLPNRLRSQRNKYGLSQKDVAAKINSSASIISAYETGERTPSVEALLALANLYQCSTDYLLGKSQTIPETYLDISDLTEPQLAALRQLIKTFRES